MKRKDPAGVLMPRVRVGKLDSVVAWRREIGKVYRAMRRGDMDHDIGAKLTYVANVAAQLVKIEEELRQRDRIAAALEQQNSALIPSGHSLLEQSPSAEGEAA